MDAAAGGNSDWRGRLSRRLPAAILLAGLAIRTEQAARYARYNPAMGEALNAATAFAQSGTIADGFGPGQGPTAHLSPVMPVLVGSIYRLFGVQSTASNYLLSMLSSGMALASFVLLYRIFGRLGTPRPWRLAGLALLCLAPAIPWLGTSFGLEIIMFRVWEGGLATLLGMAGLLWLLRLDQQEAIGWPAILALSLFAAFTFFTHAAVGLGLYLCCLAVMLRQPARRWPGIILAATSALALFLVPWALRNQRQLGEPVLLRSNFGLELAVANHQGALDPADPAAAFRAHLDAMHPSRSAANLGRMQEAGGEIAYARHMGDEARAWIAAHPADFARLCLRHLREYYLPPPWLWDTNRKVADAASQSALQGLIALLGLAGMAVALWRCSRRFMLPAIMLLAPALPYIITQPILRYRYIAFGLLVMFAADLLGRLWQAALQRRAGAAISR